MKRYNFSGFYGSYGYIKVNNDGTAFVEIIWNGYLPSAPYHKTYKTLRGAKIALGRMLESYTLKEVIL